MSKKKGVFNDVAWLKDRSKEWHCPAVVYEDAQFGTGYEPLGCSKMEVNVDCYFSTAVVSFTGEWTNYLQDEKDFVFVLQSRGSITDCTIKVKGKHIRTVAVVNQHTIDSYQSSGSNGDEKSNPNQLLPTWNEKDKTIFANSTKSHFYLPFNKVASGDTIEIECEYVESLRVVQGYYYFRMPLSFFDSETSQSMFAPSAPNQVNGDPFESRVKVTCRLNHANSMTVRDYKCPSHMIRNARTEPHVLTFETHRPCDNEEYNNLLGIGQGANQPRAFSEYFNKMIKELSETDVNSYIEGLGRAFELYFMYGTDEMAVSIEKSKNAHKYQKDEPLSLLISAHAINNPLRQDFNWQFAQAKRRERKDFEAKNNQNDGFIVNDLDTSLASCALYVSVSDRGVIRSQLPPRPCCLYFVINGTHAMDTCWDPCILEAVSIRVSELNEGDAFGICVFNEFKIRHFLRPSDDPEYKEMEENGRAASPPPSGANGSDAANDGDKHKPRVYNVSDWMPQSYGGGAPRSWRNSLFDEVKDWLELRAPANAKDMKKAMKNNDLSGSIGDLPVNISTPLIQTLCYLESPEYKEKYFKQIAFIHHGKKSNNSNNSNESNASNASNASNTSNTSNSGSNTLDDREEKLQDDRMLRQMREAVRNGRNGGKSSDGVDAQETAGHDLDEQDLMNKISFFYSDKAREYLKIEPYNTRIYTIGLGNHTNLAFLEYLARNTRAFCARCFDFAVFTWDLTNFLDSIRSPFLTFDNRSVEPVQFIYNGNEQESSQLSFPFPMPDLYLDRPVVLKYYVESSTRLKDVIVNGTYYGLNQQNAAGFFTQKALAMRGGNDIVDNDDFPMEVLLANEEIDYWHGDYWFKQGNWLFKESGQEANNPFMVFAAINMEQAQQIIGDLSDQTGIPSHFRQMISFCMTPQKYEEYTKELQSEREQSKIELSKLSLTLTVEESQQLLSRNPNGSYPSSPQAAGVGMHSMQSVQSDSMGRNSSANNSVNGSNAAQANDNEGVNYNEQQLRGKRSKINRRGGKNKNKIAAVAAVAVLGTLGVATMLNPFTGNGGGENDFFDIDLSGDVSCECCGEDIDCDGCDGCDACDECCVVM